MRVAEHGEVFTHEREVNLMLGRIISTFCFGMAQFIGEENG